MALVGEEQREGTEGNERKDTHLQIALVILVGERTC